MAVRTLTERQLNRAVLARQMLLERADLPIPKALERMGGLQAQYAPSMYVGLWSRLSRFQRADLDTTLETRAVIQGTIMRHTIHLVSRADYWPLAVAVRQSRRDWWMRVAGEGLTPERLAEAAEVVRDMVADGPRRRVELEEALGDKRLFQGATSWADLVRAPPSGTWARRRADLYADALDWAGAEPVLAPRAAGQHAVRRYLGAFGPAAPAEAANWAGLPAARLPELLEGLRLRRFRSEEGTELIDLPGAPIPDGDVPAPVRFLPTFDAILLVHCRRTGILPEEHRPKVFNTKMPQSVPTFMVDGQVAGAWRYEAGQVRLTPWKPLSPDAEEALEHEATGLAALHA